MAVAICLVPLVRPATLSAAAIAKRLSSDWPSLPEITNASDRAHTSSFSPGLANVILGIVNEPIPWSDLEGPCSVAALWPTAAIDLEQHSSHLVVTVSGESDPVALSTLLTQVAGAVLDVHSQAPGVFWSNAAKLIGRDIFLDSVRQVLPTGPPLDIWVDYRVAESGDHQSAGFTTGMHALGLMELEAINAAMAPADLLSRMGELGSYLIQNGTVVDDGAVVQFEEGPETRIVFGDSLFGHSQRVMRLAFS